MNFFTFAGLTFIVGFSLLALARSLYTLTSKHEKKRKKRTPPVGLEPTTFELEVQHASPLRHGGDTFAALQRVVFIPYLT